MQLTRRSLYSGCIHTLELPITEEELKAWQESGQMIQQFFPQLTDDEREFILSGMTPEEWEEAFPEDDEEQE